MSDVILDRHDWFRAVMQAEGLTPSAKMVAGALAIQFANPKTGQINPSQELLADYLKIHRDTVKRVLRELRNAGWLLSVGNGGRSKAPLLKLLTPGKIVPFRGRKGGVNRPLEAEQRGGKLCEKGGQVAPSHNIAEKALEKERARKPEGPSRAVARFGDHRFDGNATDGPRLILSTDYASLNAWAEWLRDNNYPKQCHLPIYAENEKVSGFYLPSKRPPNTSAAEAEARWYFETLIESEAATHAAQ